MNMAWIITKRQIMTDHKLVKRRVYSYDFFRTYRTYLKEQLYSKSNSIGFIIVIIK